MAAEPDSLSKAIENVKLDEKKKWSEIEEEEEARKAEELKAEQKKGEGKEEGKAEDKKEEFNYKNAVQLSESVHADVTVEVAHSDINKEEAPAKLEAFYDLTLEGGKLKLNSYAGQSKGISQDLANVIIAAAFDRPSPVQAYVLPISCFTTRSVLFQAPSGTGKTITFTLTSLHKVDPSRHVPQVLIMAPSMQLAQGIFKVVSTYAKPINISTQLLVAREGDNEPVNPKAQILVGTTGRLSNAFNIRDRKKPWYVDPSTISLLILDEADKMLNSQELGGKTVFIRKLCKNVKQILLSSATYSPELLEVSKRFLESNPYTTVRIVPKPGVSKYVIPKSIKHFVLLFDEKNEALKVKALEEICVELEGLVTFVFSNFKNSCHKIDGALRSKNLRSFALTGDLKPHERTALFRDFSALRYRFCISTNLGARGIDIPTCTTVINFDIPVIMKERDAVVQDAVTYVHRAGRTGRYGRPGVCITFVSSPEEYSLMENTYNECIQTDNKAIEFEVFPYKPGKIDEMIDAIRSI